MIIKKAQFIQQFLKIIEKKLNCSLPDEDFESRLLELSWGVVSNESRHIIDNTEL
jgi:hypothetical protein